MSSAQHVVGKMAGSQLSGRVLTYVIYISILFVPLVFFHPSYNTIKGTALLLGTFIGWLVLGKGKRIGIGNVWYIVIPFLAFWVSGLISLPGTISWIRGLERISLGFGMFSFYFLVRAGLPHRREQEYAARLVLIPAGIIALIGFLQLARIAPLPLDRYGQPDPASVMGLSNFASEFMMILIPLAFFGFAMRKRFQLPALIAGTLCIVYVAISQNRTAWVSLGASFLAGLLLLGYRLFFRKQWSGVQDRRIIVPLAVFAGIGALVIVLTASPPALVARARSIFHFGDASIQYRLNLWSSCWQLFREHPIRGIGVGNLEAEVPTVWNSELEHMALSQGLATQRAHNIFLEVLAERGMIGLAALLWLLATVAYTLWRKLRAQKEPGDFFWYLGISAGVFAGFVGSCFSFPLQSPASGMAFWLLVAVVSPSEKPSDNETVPGKYSKLIPLACIGISGFSLFWFGRFALAETFELRALEQVQRGNHRAAVASYSRALEMYPYLPVARQRRASFFIGQGNYDAAIADLEKTLSILPHSIGAREQLASLLARGGHYSRAMAELAHVLPLLHSPGQRGRVMIRATGFSILSKEYSKAHEYGREAVRLNPSDPAAHFYFGLASLLAGEVIPARKSFEESVRLRPDSAWSWYYLGIAYAQGKDKELSREAFRRAVALDGRMKAYTDRDRWLSPGQALSGDTDKSWIFPHIQ